MFAGSQRPAGFGKDKLLNSDFYQSPLHSYIGSCLSSCHSFRSCRHDAFEECRHEHAARSLSKSICLWLGGHIWLRFAAELVSKSCVWQFVNVVGDAYCCYIQPVQAGFKCHQVHITVKADSACSELSMFNDVAKPMLFLLMYRNWNLSQCGSRPRVQRLLKYNCWQHQTVGALSCGYAGHIKQKFTRHPTRLSITQATTSP